MIDAETAAIVARTGAICGASTLLATLGGIPAGYALAFRRFPGRRLVLGAVNTGMGLPPVLVGLAVWMLLARSGPFGAWEWIYSPRAMIVAQVVIAVPVVAGFAAASFAAVPSELRELARSFGASPLHAFVLLAREARFGLLSAIMGGFGAVVSEVGASMMVGGNLRGTTRVLTTAIVTETGRGELERAIALGITLLALAFIVNLALTLAQPQRRTA